MKLIILTIALAVSCASAASLFDATLDSHWADYKLTHNKEYESLDHEAARRQTWEENLAYIRNHNIEADNGRHTYKLGMNKYGDMKPQEFFAMVNGFNASSRFGKATQRPVFMKPSNFEVPASVDWRKQGYVTPIKDQGQCGSCWAFSAIASLEGQHFKKAGKLVSLSEQNLVDCSGDYGNQGCDGGLMDQAFEYIKANKGIDTEASYPYRAVDQQCKFKKASVGATDTGSVDVTSGDEDALVAAIASVGPISVAIDASNPSFQLYSSGVYSEPDCSSTELDHGVTAVGYGSANGKDYYIVKNSWGTSWGMDGYIQMARNSNNMCGIATSASYPTV